MCSIQVHSNQKSGVQHPNAPKSVHQSGVKDLNALKPPESDVQHPTALKPPEWYAASKCTQTVPIRQALAVGGGPRNVTVQSTADVRRAMFTMWSALTPTPGYRPRVTSPQPAICPSFSDSFSYFVPANLYIGPYHY